MSSAERVRRLLPLLLGGLAAMLYLAQPSSFFNFDGVACAIAVELGDLKHLAHGNHLGYGLAGLAFDRLLRAAGFEGPAIASLQALDSLLGALGVGLFCRLLLRRVGAKPLEAAAASAALAVSYAWWFWSLEAQVYLLGAVFLLLAADEALAEEPRPALVGLYQGAAILGHVGHLMFAPAALFLLVSRRGRRAAFSYAAGGTAVVVLAYAAAAFWCVQPRDLAELRSWLLGSAALSVDRSVTWYTRDTLSNLKDWSAMTLRVFSDWTMAEPWGRLPCMALGAAGVGAALSGLVSGSRTSRALGLWVFGYALLFASWQPYTIVYRVSDAPALVALAVLGLRKRGGAAALAAWAAAALLVNGAAAVAPRASSDRNEALQEALWASRVVPEGGWVVANGLGQVYVPYFAGRRPLNMRYLPEGDVLRKRLAELEAAGEEVYAPPSILAEPQWRRAFESYGLVEADRRGGQVFFRVTAGARKGSPKAGARRG